MIIPAQANVDSGSSSGQEGRVGWWRCFFEQPGEGRIVCSREGLVIECNSTAAEWLDTAGGAGAGMHLQQLLAEEAGVKVAAVLECSPSSPEMISGLALVTKRKRALVADVHIVPLGDGCYLLTLKDASHRWRLESHAQRLITAIDSTPDVVFLMNEQFELTFTNCAFQTATGYTIEEALGRRADFLRDPEEEGQMQEYIEVVRKGGDWMGELVNVRSDGSRYTVEACISPIYDVQGRFLGSVAFERDLTSKKKLQGELLMERNFVRSILNSLEAAVFAVDRDYQITHFNEGWQGLPPQHGWLNMGQGPAVGGSILEYVEDSAKREELRVLFESVLSDGRPRELRGSIPATSQHWHVTVAPWRDEQEVRGLIYKVSDTSQFTALQNQLYQAQKMETIGALAAGVAHDFNNLLQAIRGNVALLMLKQEKENPEQRPGPLKQIEEAASRAAEITQQLLSFSRSQDEQVMVLDFNQMIREASQLARRTLRGKVNISLEPAEQQVRVRMDATRAQQLLLNLCVNAHDAMPQGGQLTISNALVRLEDKLALKFRQKAGASFVYCQVSDTGSGIPPEILPRIFDPFFTTKAKGKGTGLGLATVHSVVSAAGGFVDVESRAGKGTTFHIYIPEAEEELTGQVTADRDSIRSGSGRILVVDDLDLVHEFTRNFLEAAGYEVLVADSADGALDILETDETPIDLLLTDYNMPEKTGWQLIVEVSERWPDIKLVLASGYMDEGERKQVEMHNGVRMLCKPYNISEATSIIAELLAEKRAGG